MITTKGARTMLYPATDLASVKAIFSTLLGVDPMANEPYYVGFAVAGSTSGATPTARAGA